MKNTTIVNLFAGPGAGKSSICSGLHSHLKWLDIDCEMALEYAKDMVWQNSMEVLRNQLYVFGKQQNRIFRLLGKVDVIITDAPLLNSLIYDADKALDRKAAFMEMVLAEHRGHNNLNFMLRRCKKYNPNGRLQNEAEARNLDQKILRMMDTHQIGYLWVNGQREHIPYIVDRLFETRPDLKPTTNE